MEQTKLSRRWKPLEVFRAVAVVMMVIGHILIVWFMSDRATVLASIPQAKPYMAVLLTIIGFFVFSIPIVAGAALRFSFNSTWDELRQKLTWKKRPYLFRDIGKRGLILLLIGYGVNLLASLLNYLQFGFGFQILSNVLLFFALSIFVITLLLKLLNIYWLGGFGILAIASAPFLSRVVFAGKTPYIWMIFFGDSEVYSFWPFFPWVGVVIFGFLTAQLYLTLKNKRDFSKILGGVGILFFLAALLSGVWFQNIESFNSWSRAFFQPPTLRIIGQLGVFSLLIASLEFFLGKRAAVYKPYGFINTFSRGILYIYIFNLTFGIWLANLIKINFTDAGVFTLHNTMPGYPFLPEVVPAMWQSAGVLFLVLILQLALSYGLGVARVYFKNKYRKHFLTQ